VIPARVPMFAAATRANKAGRTDSVLSESELYDR
jgi:hypothetical protein